MESKAYAQSYYIIQNLSDELKAKIPKEVLNGIKSKISAEDEVEMKVYPNIKDIELLEDAEKILSVIYTDYLATDEERKIIKNKERLYYIEQENQKKEKYSIDIFENRKKETTKEMIENNKIAKITKEKWYSKLIQKIKDIFRKK